MNRLVIDLNVDTDYFDEALEELMEAQATQDCWDLVGEVEKSLSEFCRQHSWAGYLYSALSTATQDMEARPVADALGRVAEDLATDAPAIANLARKAFVKVRVQEFGLSTSL